MSIACYIMYSFALISSTLAGSYLGTFIDVALHDLLGPFVSFTLTLLGGFFVGNLLTKNIIMIFILLTGITTCEAMSYTSTELFSKLDVNEDGVLSKNEFLREMKKLQHIDLKHEDCGCFRCDGSLYSNAHTCDIYQNSGCDSPSSNPYFCYTTNTQKCICNNASANPGICKIPLTYSFTSDSHMNNKICYTDIPASSHNKEKYQTNEKPKSSSAYEMYERSSNTHSNEYTRGWNAAVDDVLDIATTAIVVDTVSTIFVDTLVGKDPF